MKKRQTRVPIESGQERERDSNEILSFEVKLKATKNTNVVMYQRANFFEIVELKKVIKYMNYLLMKSFCYDVK